MKRRLLICFLGVGILFCILFPQVVTGGAKEGLSLWFYTVMPSLLPFMILSTFLIKQGFTEPISRVFAPLLTRLFSIPKRCCYPVVIGFLSGFPVGAKVTGQMYVHGEISKEEAMYLLSFCNNASPMFLISFIGGECLQLKFPAEMFFFILFSAWIASLFTRRKYRIRSGGDRSRSDASSSVKKRMRLGVIESLDESIMDGFITMARVGGYILLFSIIIRMILEFVPLGHSIKYIGIGFLEITTGGMLLSGAALKAWLKYSVFAGLCAFGGVSSIFQTASVIRETGLSLKGYIASKIRQCFIACCLSAVWFLLQRNFL